MTLNLEDEYGLLPGLDSEKTARMVAEQVLEDEECPYEAQVNLLLTSDEEIHQMNLQYREVDRPTDVLSFPQVEYEVPADFSWAEAHPADCFDPDSGELLLGDIVISMDKVREQAEKYNHSVRREFAFLVAHSMLHLLGYDHMNEEAAADMELRQEAALQKLCITRDGEADS
ncbi:MAG: rRNA maturation RNase YbeY [Eubacteriales bacterium]|nr:rRNA maturation RNase YbeY [Eubacteriales bacterium]